MLIVTEFLTLDGVGQAPGGRDEDPSGGFEHGGWQAPLGDASAGGVVFEDASTMDALVLGRRTYDNFADYWPKAPDTSPFARLLNNVPKFVASRTLAGPLAWNHSSLLTGDLAASVQEVKDRFDEVHVIGSLGLVQSLLRHRLVDQLDLWVYPVLLGSGKQLFADGTVPTTLRLVDSITYPSGTLHLRYDATGTPTYADIDG
jgi:dihydrofolate reductase